MCTISGQSLAKENVFSIAAMSVPEALDLFSRTSGIQVVASAEILENLTSSEINGEFSTTEALNSLLSGTDLTWYMLSENTVVIEKKTTAIPLSSGVMLPAVKIEGQGIKGEEDKPFQTAGSSSFISQKQIERFRGSSVGDIFQGETGVLVGENRNSGGLDVNIRGMQGQGRVPVLIDGSRQETTVYRGYSGVSSRTYIDPDLIGGIEIDKGPSMSAQGTGATGGLVNMRTINTDDIIKPGQDWGVRIRGNLFGNNSGQAADSGTTAGYGSSTFGGTYYRIGCAEGSSLCDGGYALENAYGPEKSMDRPDMLDLRGYAGSIAVASRYTYVDVTLAYAKRAQGNYYAGKNGPTPSLDISEQYNRGFYTEVRVVRDGASRFRAEERIVNSNMESESVLLKGEFFLPNEQSLELSYQYYDSQYGELMPSQLLWLSEITQTDPSTVTAQTYVMRYKWQPLNMSLVDLKFNIWHTDTKSKNNGYSAGIMELWSMEEPDAEKYQRWGGDLSNTMHFPSLNDLQLEFGVAAQYENVKPLNEEITPLSMMRDGNRQEFSAFSAFKWPFLSSLTLDGGIRYSHFKSEDNKPVYVTESSDYCVEIDGNTVCDEIYIDAKGSGYAPMLSLLWEPYKGLQLYAQYAEALRMPSLFETTSGFSVSATPESELKPEHAKNKEIGFNLLKSGVFQQKDILRFKLSYFQNQTENYLTRTIPNSWDDTSAGMGANTFSMKNIDSVKFHGAELSIDYDMQWLYGKFSVTKYNKIEICHTGSYRREECTNYGLATSYINNMIPPNWNASLETGFRLFDKTLESGFRFTFMGERNQTPEYNDQTSGTGRSYARPIPWHDYQLVDYYLSWSPNDKFTLDFNIYNLTDQYYLDALSLGMVPAPGRTVKIGTTLQF